MNLKYSLYKKLIDKEIKKNLLVFLLFIPGILFSSEIVNISFISNWTVQNGAEFSNDTLVLTGISGKYVRAQQSVSIATLPKDLYFVADVELSNIVLGAKSTSLPKLKIYDSNGLAIQAFNMEPILQNEWYTTGMMIARFDNLNQSPIIIEFGMQDCEGVMKVANPKLLDSPPVVEYKFPFDIPSSQLSIDLISNETHKFNDNLLSMNAHFVHSRPLSWSNQQVMSILSKKLQLGNMRFPAGTVGNFYDWKTDGFYGDEWTFLSPSREKAYKEGFRFDYLGFVQNVKNLNATTTLMFNVIKDDITTATDRFKSRINDSLDIVWIELGNENFFAEQSFGNVDTPEKYVSHTKAVTASLKAVDPLIKVAVNTDHHDYNDGSWNDILSQEDYYDGCVMHPYTKTGTFLLNKPALRTIYTAYGITKKRFEEHRSMFPNKPLVLSEWNILSDGAPLNFAQALGVADQFLAIVEGGDEGLVVQAGLHTFCHSEYYSEQTLYYGTTDNLYRTRLAVIYEKIIEFFKGAELYNANSNSAEVFDGVPGVQCRAIVDGDFIKIFAVNKLPIDAPLSVSLDGKTVTGEYSMEYFTEPMVGDSTGYSLEANPWKTGGGTGNVAIPASSIAVVRINKNSSTVDSKCFDLQSSVKFMNDGFLFKNKKSRNIEIFTLAGRLVRNRLTDEKKINISSFNLTKGIYLLMLKDANYNFLHKIIVH